MCFTEIMNNATLINQTSGKVEWYSDPRIIDAARQCMGGIDFDPASSKIANVAVRATVYCDFAKDGMKCLWVGKVFLNFPFGRPEPACLPGCEKDHEHHSYPLYGNAAWINKLCREFESGRVTEACCLTFAATSEKWFQPLLKRPMCFLHPRTNYYDQHGKLVKGVTKGSAVSYFGLNVEGFREALKEFGEIKVSL